MSSINHDLGKVLSKEHEEKWVALNKEQTKVIDYSKVLSELRARVGEKNTEVVYMKVPRADTVYAF